MTYHLNSLIETVQMRGHTQNMVSMRNRKNCLSIIIKYHLFSRALSLPILKAPLKPSAEGVTRMIVQGQLVEPLFALVTYRSSTYLNKCFKWHFFSSKKTTVPNYFEIHAQMYKLRPRQILTDARTMHARTYTKMKL